MNDNKKRNKASEFDPEGNKEVDKGPLKSEHINQYGEKDDRNRNMSKRVDEK